MHTGHSDTPIVSDIGTNIAAPDRSAEDRGGVAPMEPFTYRKRQRLYQSKHEIELIRKLECCIENRHADQKFVDWTLVKLATWSSFNYSPPLSLEQMMAADERPHQAILLLQKVSGLFEMLLETLATCLVNIDGTAAAAAAVGNDDRMMTDDDDEEEEEGTVSGTHKFRELFSDIDMKQLDLERRALLSINILRNLSFMRQNQQVMVTACDGALLLIVIKILRLDVGDVDVPLSTVPRFIEFKQRAMELLANLARAMRLSISTMPAVQKVEDRIGDNEYLSRDELVMQTLQLFINMPEVLSAEDEKNHVLRQLRLSALEAMNALLTHNAAVYADHLAEFSNFFASVVELDTIETIGKFLSKSRDHKGVATSQSANSSEELRSSYEFRLTARSFAVNIIHVIARLCKENHELYALTAQGIIRRVVKLLWIKYNVQGILNVDAKRQDAEVSFEASGKSSSGEEDEDDDEYMFEHLIAPIDLQNQAQRHPHTDQSRQKTAFKERCIRTLLLFAQDTLMQQYDDAIAKLTMVASRSRHIRCEQLFSTLLSTVTHHRTETTQ